MRGELLLQLLQFFFGLCMIGMLLEELQKYGFRFFTLALEGVNARQVQISLVIRGRQSN